jgi:hypothetical protein
MLTTKTTILLAMSALTVAVPSAAFAQPFNAAIIDDRDYNTQVNYASVYQHQEADNEANADNDGFIGALAFGEDDSTNTSVAANAAVAASYQSQSSSIDQSNTLSDDDTNTIVQVLETDEEEEEEE